MNLLYEEVPYALIDKNWNNRANWEEYNKCIYIALNIPATEVACTPDEKIARFTRNWKTETAVAKKLDLHFYDNTHEYFHSGSGDPLPDFIDDQGKTYELKNTNKYAYDDHHWWGADVHLYYDHYEGIVYEQIADGRYLPLEYVSVRELGE